MSCWRVKGRSLSGCQIKYCLWGRLTAFNGVILRRFLFAAFPSSCPLFALPDPAQPLCFGLLNERLDELLS